MVESVKRKRIGKYPRRKRKGEVAMDLKIKTHRIKPLKFTGSKIKKIKEDLISYEKEVLGFDEAKAKKWANLATKPLQEV